MLDGHWRDLLEVFCGQVSGNAQSVTISKPDEREERGGGAK